MKFLRQRAFSMLELSVVLAIIALIVGAGLTIGTNAIATAKRVQTKERLETIKYALEAYVKMNDYYPFPANRTQIPTNASFGREVRPIVASGQGIKSIGAAGAGRKWIGMVPVRSLGLPDSYAADAWGNKFNYIVMEQLASNAKSTTALGMPIYLAQLSSSSADDNTSITDRTIIPSTPAAIVRGSGAGWVVVSYGPDGEGAFPLMSTSATAATACAGGDDYGFNCSEGGTFRDLPWNDGSADYKLRYDDMLVWGSHEQDRIPVTTTQPASCATGCEAWCAPCTNNLHSGAPANMNANTRNLCRKFITSTSPCQATCLWSGTLTASSRRITCP